MFDKDNKFGFIVNNSNNNIEGLDNIKTDINNIKDDVDKLNTQYKDIVKKVENGNIGNNVEPELMDMPRIYFSEGTLPTSKTATVMKFDYYSKTNEYHGYVDIKCQGNSSMSYPKKNFTIKPYKDKAKTTKLKIDFKGWGKQSKFVLKANWIDLTHARNVVSARLWGDIIKTRSDYATALPELLRTSPNQGAIDGFPVLVYSNGVYQGRYTLNIPKDKWMSNMDDALDTHCILCGENYQSGCFRALPNINGSDWTDELHDVVPASIKTSWTNAIKFVMNSSDVEFKTNLSNYFDVNSLIDYYLYGLVSTNLDGFGKNQLFFCYDGVHWIASVYDLDSTWGLYWNGSRILPTNYARNQYEDYANKTSNLLYNRLEQLYITQLKARYTELRKDVLSASHIIQKFEEFNDVCPKDIVQEDYASTTGGGKFTGIPSTTTNNIQQIRSNIVARLTYVDGYINALQEATPCTNITLNKTELTITGNSSTEIPSDENIDITKNTQKGFICRSGNHITGTLKYGDIRDSSQDITTDFIPCNSTNTFELTMPSSTYGAGIVAYDLNKDAIKVYTADNQWASFGTGGSVEIRVTALTISSIPENTAYIRICFNLHDLSNVVLTKKYSAGSATPTEETINTTWTSGALCRTSRAVSIKNTPFGNCFSSDADITTDFIPSTSSSTFTVVTPKPISVGGGIGVVGYDSSKNAITVYEYKNNEYSWTNGISENETACTINGTNIPIQNIPDNVAYIKICINQSTSNNTTITKTTTTQQEKLIATVTPTNTTDKVVWSVSPTGICTVENGVVTPIKNGECVVTATCGTKSATCNVTVNLQVEAVTALNLDKDSIALGNSAEVDTSNVNLLDGINHTIDATTNNVQFDPITLDAGAYVFRNINGGTFTWLGANYDGENHETGDITNEIMFKFDESKSVQFHAFPNNKSTNTVDKLGLYKLGKLINPMKFTVAGNGYYKDGQLVTDSNNEYSTTVTLDSSKKYVLMNDSDAKIDGNLCAWFINNKSYKGGGFNISSHSPIKLFENVSSLSVSINTVNNALSDLTLYEVSSSTSQKYEDTLIATLTPANATNKNVTWTADNENVMLVPNGLKCTVKAKAVGNSVVTCTSQDTTNGTITDTCNVTVNAVPTVPATPTVLYTLPQETTFNGTSDYIDTGVQLLKTDQDFTITMDVTADTKILTQSCLIHCMMEQSPYKGINMQSSGADEYYTLNSGNNVSAIRNLVPIGQRTKVVIVKNGTTMKAYDSNNFKGESPYNFTSIDQTLLLGAYQTVEGTKGRYFKGTIHAFSISNTVYTNEQINTYLGVNVATD